MTYMEKYRELTAKIEKGLQCNICVQCPYVAIDNCDEQKTADILQLYRVASSMNEGVKPYKEYDE